MGTHSTMTARMERLSSGAWASAEIAGVDGLYPSVDLFLKNPVGAKTGRLLPTMSPTDVLDGISVSCVDVTVPMMIARASDLGKTASESVQELQNDLLFMEKLQTLWVQAGLRMGLKNFSGALMTAEDLALSETIPKVCIVGAPDSGGNIKARYFTPQAGHKALAVSGGCCLATACLIPGTVAHRVATGVAPLNTTIREVTIASNILPEFYLLRLPPGRSTEALKLVELHISEPLKFSCGDKYHSIEPPMSYAPHFARDLQTGFALQLADMNSDLRKGLRNESSLDWNEVINADSSETKLP